MASIVAINMVFKASPWRRFGVQASFQARRPARHDLLAYGVASRRKASPRRPADATRRGKAMRAGKKPCARGKRIGSCARGKSRDIPRAGTTHAPARAGNRERREERRGGKRGGRRPDLDSCGGRWNPRRQELESGGAAPP